MVVRFAEHKVGKARRKDILEVVKDHALLRGDFTLSSGQKSPYYWDGKMAMTWPKAIYLIAEEVLEVLESSDVKAVGGLAIGADLIVSAVAMMSYIKKSPLPAFVIRDKRKEHGTKKLVEGQIPKEKGAKVAIVDDIITTGTSIIQGISEVEDMGYEVTKVVVLLDRHMGGSDELRRRGYDFTALLHSDAAGNVYIEDPCSAVA